MNMRTNTLDNRAGRAKRSDVKARKAAEHNGRAAAKNGRTKRTAEEPAKRGKGPGAQLDRPRGGRDIAVRENPDTGPRKRSGAAKRAYERRQQRATLHGGDAVATAALPTRSTRFTTRIPFVATVIGLLACGLMCTLLLTTRAAEDSYQLSAARAHNQHLSQERASLQRAVETADSAPDLAAKARDLGMIPAKDPARLLVAPDGGVAVVGKPVPAQGPPVPLLNGPGRNGANIGTPRTNRAAEQPRPSDTPQRAVTDTRAQGEQLVPMAIPGQAAIPAPTATGGRPR